MDLQSSITVHVRKRKQKPSLKISFGGIEFTFANRVKQLGFYIDSSLSFSSHINHVTRTMHIEQNKIFYYERNCNTVELVNSLILTKLDYCNSLSFANISKDKIGNIQTVQNNAARLILIKGRNAISILNELHWQQGHRRIIYTICYGL